MENSNASDKKISVVIPTFHRTEELKICLEHLLKNTYSDYEVIVTDDGTSSETRNMIEESFPSVRWFKGPQRGPAANRNSGAAQATFDWIAFTDDDCEPSKEWLSALSEAIVDRETIYEGKTECVEGIDSPLQTSPINLTGGYFWSCNLFLHKSAFLKLQGFDEAYPRPHMEDVDFRERFRQLGFKERFVENAVVNHPPRIDRRGLPRILNLESEYYYLYKFNKPGIYFFMHLKILILIELNKLKQHKFSFSLLKSNFYCIQEVFLLSMRAPSWQRKYQHQFKQ